MNKTSIIRSGDITIEYCDYAVSPSGLDQRHCHSLYEVIYILDGNGKYIVEGVEYPVRPRTLIIAPPFAYHCMILDGESHYERYVVHFSLDDLTASSGSHLRTIGDSTALYYSAEAITTPIASLFERYENIERLPQKDRLEYARLLTSELMLLLSAVSGDAAPRDELELGAKAIKYLNEHIDEDIPLEKLAKKFFVSKYYLCRAFKKHNGISVHGYINQKRVAYAKQLIESGETASGAAYKVGFGDYSAFYRAYMKIEGVSPTKQSGGKERRDV